ncbi:arsenate reductase ArsC [Streptomyces sp. NPDC058374]|uniref:arsenate reductase ArsC n=1 Tax=unclassified Streptomyces TaxID=2593676 RepID=UPI00364F0EFE
MPAPEPAPAATPAAPAPALPSVLFVCVHNAGRSQMAAAFLTHLAGGAVEVRSAGSAPADTVNPVAVAAMAEVGLDLTHARPRALTPDAVRAADLVVTMGCGDACPVLPGTAYRDWALDDPAGQELPAVRLVRDAVERRVRELLAELEVTPVPLP